jgi:hypothetical protein
MIGYIEEPFKTLDRFELLNGNKKQVFELRQTLKKDDSEHIRRFRITADRMPAYRQAQENKDRPYISITIHENKAQIADYLLFYTSEKNSHLSQIFRDKDWASLRDVNVTLDELDCFSWVENHATGRNKDGGVIDH